MSSLTLGVVDYIVICLMLAASAAIGIYFRFSGGRQKTVAEILLAGRTMPIFPVVCSIMATYLSGVSFLGRTSETYMYGTQYLVSLFGKPIGYIIAAYVIHPVYFHSEISSIHEYLEKRFGKLTRTIVSSIFVFTTIFFISLTLYAPSLALNVVTGVSTWTSVLCLVTVCTFYSSLGGLKAVLWADVLQGGLMLVAIFAILIKACIDVGGVQRTLDIANEGGRLIFFNFSPSLEERYTFWNSFVCDWVECIATFGANQLIIQRLFCVGSLKRSQRALILSFPLTILFQLGCIFGGVAIYSLFHDCDPVLNSSNHLTKPDQVIPFAILKLFNHIPGLSGLCIAGIFSASLSTISSGLNSLAAVTVVDFIRPFCSKISESWMPFLTKMIAVFYGCLCILMVYVVDNFQGVMIAGHVLIGALLGPLTAVFLLGVLTRITNEPGLLIGLLFGLAFGAWRFFGMYFSALKSQALHRSVEGCLDVNGTSSLNSTTRVDEASNSDVFPLYRVSFTWFMAFGFLPVFIIGYISSFLISCFKEQKDVDPNLVSPVLRKWLFRENRNRTRGEAIDTGEMAEFIT